MIPRNDSLTGDWQFRQWLQSMLSFIATKVEHYRPLNDSGVEIEHGSVVYASGNDEMDLAIYDALSIEKERWIGVTEKDVPDGERGTIKNAGFVEALFEDGLDLSIKGALVYVSDSLAGAVTNVDSLGAVVGTLADASEYDGVPGSATYNPYAKIYLRSQCAGRN